MNPNELEEPDIIECLQDYQLMLTAIAQRHKNQKQRVGAFNKARAVKQLIERLIDIEKEEDAPIPA